MRVIRNGSRYTENGWDRINVKGTPYEIGFAHGFLVSKELEEIIRTLSFTVPNTYGYSLDILSNVIYDIQSETVRANFPDIYKELEGILAGAISAGFKKLTIEKLFYWNCVVSIASMLTIVNKTVENDRVLKKKYGDVFNTQSDSLDSSNDKCTAFIAVGDWTKDGKIVCAHNTFDDFTEGQFFNILMYISPSKGNSFMMQTAAGQVSSGTDYYITSNGFIVTETTIGGFNKYAQNYPAFCRIRKAVQFSKTLDDYVEILKDGNSGDYANSWLIGDTKKNEIMRIELGLKYMNVERKKNGYFIGFNATYDDRIRNLECSNSGFYDIRRHQGARHVRLEQLMKQHKGKIDIGVGQLILADHYDVYLNKENPCSRTCCAHYDLDAREFMSQSDRPLPFQPKGVVDGIVSDSKLAASMGLSARWGTSCGMPFVADEFLRRNAQWNDQKPYIKNRPSEEWTIFKGKILKNKGTSKYMKKIKIHTKTKNKLKLKTTRKINKYNK